MRLWSLHPEYLDQKGLCGLWHEGIMALNALANPDHGYAKHPQLQRFTLNDLQCYMIPVCYEGQRRGYKFDILKLVTDNDQAIVLNPHHTLSVTHGQAEYEAEHLWQKLRSRGVNDIAALDYATKIAVERPYPRLNPIFRLVDGPIEPWEKVQ
jgi:hypothetical protein